MGQFTAFPIPTVALSVVGKAAATIGDGASTTFTVTHNLNTLDVTVAVYTLASGIVASLYTATIIDANNIQLTFQSAPALSSLRCVVMG